MDYRCWKDPINGLTVVHTVQEKKKKQYHNDIFYNTLFRLFLWASISDKSFQVLMENFESTYEAS